MKRAIIIIGIVVILAVGGFFGWRAYQQSQAAKNSNFQTLTVSRGDLTASVGATGTVRTRQSVTSNWQTSGRVGEINVKVGDAVRAGQLLGSLDETTISQSIILARADLVTARRSLDTLLNSNVARANAQQALTQAQKALEDAQDKRESKDYARATDLTVEEARANLALAEDAVSKAEHVYDMVDGLDEADPNRAAAFTNYANAQRARDRALANLNYLLGRPDDLEVSQADAAVFLAEARLKDAQTEWDRLKDGPDQDDVEAAKARITALESTLAQVAIQSPIDGIVTEINVMPGDQVTPGGNPAQPAFRIDDQTQLLVDVEITEVDINLIRVGQPVTFTFDAIGDREYAGQVIEVDSLGTNMQGVVNFTITIQLTNTDELVRPGMTAAVNIITDMLENVLLVPNRAVRLRDGQRVVWVLQDGAAVMTPITLGKTADTQSEVIDGDLSEGDTLVLNPPTPSLTSGGMGGIGPGQ